MPADGPEVDHLRHLKQIADRRLIVHRNMQVAARDADVAMPCGVPHLGERSAAGQGVAKKPAPAVEDGQRSESGGAKRAKRLRTHGELPHRLPSVVCKERRIEQLDERRTPFLGSFGMADTSRIEWRAI